MLLGILHFAVAAAVLFATMNLPYFERHPALHVFLALFTSYLLVSIGDRLFSPDWRYARAVERLDRLAEEAKQRRDRFPADSEIYQYEDAVIIDCWEQRERLTTHWKKRKRNSRYW